MTGPELKALRESTGLTQEELAKLIKVGRVTITRYELGKRDISEPMALLFNLVLGGIEVPVFDTDGSFVGYATSYQRHGMPVGDNRHYIGMDNWTDKLMEAYRKTGAFVLSPESST